MGISERLPRRGVLAVLTLLAGGCGGGGDASPPWAGAVDTLPDGAVRVHSPDAPVWPEGAGPRLVEVLRVGAGEPAFGQVPDIAPTEDGGVWILDGEARQVVRVDAAGREERRIGRGGDAENEFQYPRRLHLRGDTLWVEDLGTARWSAWSTGGVFLGAFALPDGLAGGNASWTAAGLMGVERRRVDDAVVRWAGLWVPEGGVFVRRDSLPPPPVPEPVALQATFTRDGRPVSLAFPLPLAHQPGAVAELDGSGWVVTPGGGEYRIVRVARDGTPRREIVRDYTPVPVPDAEREAAVARLPAELRESEAHRVPTAWPPFDRIVPAADGSLWVVRRDGDGRTVFDLFDPEGRYRGAVGRDVDLEGVWLHAVDEWGAWGVVRDEAGRPVVIRFALEGAGD